jgi:hypothetical protein
MNDALLASTDTEEALSRTYVAGVAASAGYVTAQMDFDAMEYPRTRSRPSSAVALLPYQTWVAHRHLLGWRSFKCGCCVF